MSTDEKQPRATVLTPDDAKQLLCIRNYLAMGHLDCAVAALEGFADPEMTKIDPWGWVVAIAGGTAADYEPAVPRGIVVQEAPTLGDFTEASELDIEFSMEAPAIPVLMVNIPSWLLHSLCGPAPTPEEKKKAFDLWLNNINPTIRGALEEPPAELVQLAPAYVYVDNPPQLTPGQRFAPFNRIEGHTHCHNCGDPKRYHTDGLCATAHATSRREPVRTGEHNGSDYDTRRTVEA